MATLTALVSGGWGWIAAVFAGLVALFGVYFGGKKIGSTQTQAKADVAAAEVKTEAVKVAAKHESEVVTNANTAKVETAGRTDDELRDRMRDQYTKP
ncbi:hypothetical protein AH03_30 [Erwinia phage AH03]|uniref:Uncharacterized protein n=1 Tax=Erwinia phage AH03 TaxID=2869568 RepID=A0AAE7X0K9_9CAUD|nr:hypothetical protein AH03_30 [Erwinia phage AH03]